MLSARGADAADLAVRQDLLHVLAEVLDALLERLDEDVRQMPINYVTKADYKSDIMEVKEMLGKIFDRLETKADK